MSYLKFNVMGSSHLGRGLYGGGVVGVVINLELLLCGIRGLQCFNEINELTRKLSI